MLAIARQGAVVLLGAVFLAPSLAAVQDGHEEDCIHLTGYAGPTPKPPLYRSSDSLGGPNAALAAGICAVDNARVNRSTPIKTGADFVPITGDDSLGFYCVYGVKASSTGGVGGNVSIYILELAGGEVMLFGSGYGNIQGANLFDAAYDMERVDQVIRYCMGREPALTPIRIVAPHGHGDHINPACNRELERLGYRILEIAFSQGDFAAINGMAWNSADRGLFRIFPTSTTCLQELASYSSPLGKIWFFDRPGHTAGSIDMVIDVLGAATNRMVVRGSQPSAPCTPVPGQREILPAHGNVELLSIPPTLVDVGPFVGTSLGGTSLTLTGTNFTASGAGTPKVLVDGVHATAVNVVSGTSLTCTTPAGRPGQLVDVVLVNNNGKALYSSAFFYNALPTVTSITPSSGDWNGSTVIQVRGSGFTLNSGINEVFFGASKAAAVSVKSDTLLTCRTPAGVPGTSVPVVVRNPNGEGTFAGSYRYNAALAILSTTPASASSLGGTTVLLSGSSFTGSGAPPSVTFGGIPATGVTLVSDTSVSVAVPPGVPGALVDIVLTNSAGSATFTGFRYNNLPRVLSLLPASGRPSGKTQVVLSGSGFLDDGAGTNLVRFGGIPATQVTVLADDSLRCLTPAGVVGSQVNITVTNLNGTATLPLAFTYLQPLGALSILPDSGTSLGGTEVTILGSGFLEGPAGPTAVTFGGTPASTVIVVDDGTLTCIAPPGAPLTQVSIQLTNSNGTVAVPTTFRYHAVPALTTIAPNHGHAVGSTPVTLTGQGFLADAAGPGLVVVAGITASDVDVLSDTTLTCVFPPGTPGASADILLVNQNGTATLLGAFRYHTLPSVASISPASGPAGSRPRVTLTGTGFADDDAGLPTVRFGAIPATGVSVLGDTTVRCDAPLGTPGQSVDIVLGNNRGSATLATGYRFHALPGLTSVTPARGTFLGGTTVTLVGSGFQVDAAGPCTITFGGVPAGNVVVSSDTSVTCTTPANSLGAIVDVVITNANGSKTLVQGFSYTVAAPSVASLTPASGPAHAPGSVQLTGAGFVVDAAGTNTVQFGGVPTGIVTVIDDTRLSCQVPPGTPGARVDVSVTNANGTGQIVKGFRYHALPALTSLAPNTGSSLGGTTVVLSGAGFKVDSPGIHTVTFGGVSAQDITATSDTRLTCTIPPGVPGSTVEVLVGNANGQASASSFTYNPLPSLTELTPGSGPLTGGSLVTLRGTGFLANDAGSNTVLFGLRAGFDVTVLSDTELTCTTPRGNKGFVDVRISNGNGSSVIPAAFHYGKLPPAITSIEPESGPANGQNLITIRGHGFEDLGAGQNRVKFGTAESNSVITVDDETVLCLAPAGAAGSIVEIALNNNSGTVSASQPYRYHLRPTLTSITPTQGQALKTTRVSLTGSGFAVDSPGETSVRFGGVYARDVRVISDTRITCLAQGGGPGALLDVTVRNDNGAATLPEAFAVSGDPPAILGISPARGPFSGGTEVELIGSGFSSALLSLTFGGAPATDIRVLDDRRLRCLTPPGTIGTRVSVSLRVKTGLTTVLEGFEYTALLPELQGVGPGSGPAAGGTIATLTGTSFLAQGAGLTRVYFGLNAAANVLVLDDRRVTCTVPAGEAGSEVEVLLQNDNGSSAMPAAFRYHALPTLSALTPAQGLADGGTAVALTGTGFLLDGAGPNLVSFAGVAAQQVVVVSDTRITCKAPAGTPATKVDVVVSNQNGAATLVGGFRYRTKPILTAVTPSRGPSAGGTELRLTGTGFTSDAAGTNLVTIGGVPALAVVTLGDTTIFCTSPPGAASGPADVVVVNGNGSTTSVGGYEYFVQPALTALAPNRGPAEGGTIVTLTGRGFLGTGPGTNLVLFGGLAALDVIEHSDTSLTCTTPPGVTSTLVDVTLANPNGVATLIGAFRYHGAPTLVAVTPPDGPPDGGPVTLTGSGFTNDEAGPNTVTFGGLPATQVVALSDTTLTCRAPAGTAGTRVDVSLANANGQSTLAQAFRYRDRPTLTGVAPTRGPVAGGTVVTLAGTGFVNDGAGANQVRIGGALALSVVTVDDTTLTCTTPPGAGGGPADVVLTNANGSATLAGGFEFFLAPTLASLTPDHGSASGGTPVTLTGQGFLSASGANLVLFGGVAAQDVIELSDTSLTCTTPPGTAGVQVDVTLANENGSSTLSAAFRYHGGPVLAAVTPGDGPAKGTPVTLTGSGFQNDDAGTNTVTFGLVPASQVVVVDDATITCRAPAGAAGTSVDVRVSNANGESLLSSGFRYRSVPTLLGLTPSRGPAAGANTVTLTGTGFASDGASAPTVTFGFLGANNVVVLSDTTITCLPPGGTASSLVDVTVANSNGSAALTKGYGYYELPTIATVAPSHGSELGGTLVTLTGSGFSANDAGPCTVFFGASQATNVSVIDDATLTCLATSGLAGSSVDVRVSNRNGSATRTAAYRYDAAPRLLSIDPVRGPAEGGTLVTLTGSGFADPAAETTLVTFGAQPATGVVVLSDTSVSCNAPAGAAGTTVSVQVANAVGQANLPAAFRYHATPVLGAVVPARGSSAVTSSVTVQGSGFLVDDAGTNALLFGAAPATNVVVLNDTTLSCDVAPQAAGTVVDVRLTNANGSAIRSAAFAFDAPAPTLVSIQPASGASLGGTPVRLTGTGFQDFSAGFNTVSFGLGVATSVVVLDDTTLDCLTPPGTAGTSVDVTVTNANGSALLSAAYAYVAVAPVVASVSPPSGIASGGGTLLITGSAFQSPGAGANAVQIGGVPAADVITLGDTQIQCTVPAGASGASVDVEVSNANGSGSLVAGYRYHASPAITSISPDHGTALGGTLITVRGSGFLDDGAGPNLVQLGGTSATSIVVFDDGRLTCRAPSGASGVTLALSVGNQNGSTVLPDAYRYHAKPVISAVSPASGKSSGGNRVTLTGSGFLADGAVVNIVSFGGVTATSVAVLSNTTLECNVPAGTSGLAVQVTVANVNGTALLPGGYRYHARPLLTAVAPASGNAVGGENVTLTGSGFLVDAAGTNTVTFGGAAASSVIVLSDTQLSCSTPPGTASTTVDVVLSNANGASTLFGGYTYDGAIVPAVAATVPSKGSTLGSTAVTLIGSGFEEGSSVSFGGLPAANVVVLDSHTITCLTPASVLADWVDVRVQGPSTAASLRLGYWYVDPPVVEAIEPPRASPRGGAMVVVRGSGFLEGEPGENIVTIGGQPALSVAVLDDQHLVCEVPGGPALTDADVEVTNDNGTSRLPLGLRWQLVLSTDIDSDGRGDLILSSPGDDDAARDAGAVRVFFGAPMPLLDRNSGQADVTALPTQVGTDFGMPVASGDLNGDGNAELVVGAPGNDSRGLNAGSVFVFGGPVSLSPTLLTTDQADLELFSARSGDRFGSALLLRDFDRNGILDLLVGITGRSGSAQLFLGNSTEFAIQPALILAGRYGNEGFATTLAAGDLDGDGWTDFVVGAPNAYGIGNTRPGEVRVFRGGPDVFSGQTLQPWLTFSGLEGGENFGRAVAVADLSGDGIDDLVVGAPSSSLAGPLSGAVFVFFGGSGLVGGDTGTAGVVLGAEGPGDHLGRSLATGDVDGDGRADLMIGAPDHAGDGRAYLFLGDGVFDHTIASQADAVFDGETGSQGEFGTTVAFIDLDGNGLEDIIVTAPGLDLQGSDLGRVYVFEASTAPQRLGTNADGTLTGRDAGDQLGRYMSKDY